tara:strand:- start:1351 stop:2991 length:1641 start_codon:yes stop_codon:yes gene_type:complete
MKTTKYFYEKSKFKEFVSNISYHQLLKMSDDDFNKWAKSLRNEVASQWDTTDTPPVIGKDEEGIIKSFKKLSANKCDFLQEDYTDDSESLGIIQNFNKDASACNQFFPTMLKTKISIGKSADGGLSIYDHFALPELEDKFIRVMKRAVKRDSMYSYSRSIVNKKDENPFWDGESAYDFIKKVKDENLLSDKWKDIGIWIARVKDLNLNNYGTTNEAYKGFGNLYMSADEVNELKDEGYLSDTMLSNIDEITDKEVLKSGKENKFYYLIRWYDKTIPIFPKILQIFRLSCGQPAVNFPALTAKMLYEKYTEHIPSDKKVTVYDPSSGWGGRILGAMSSNKKIHYVGTDPNTDNIIDELGISRYQYLADFYNEHCTNDYSDTALNFFEPIEEPNTFEVFSDGSELIGNNPKFQKYKQQLDFVFTSPPYFNREQYSDDESQSFKAYSQYEDWRDNFLRPTLTTAYEYLKHDRYILWNIASIKIGSDTYYDLEGDSRKILEELGCEYKGKLKMLMTRMVGLDPSKSGILNSVKHQNKAYKYEPIFVFYKG